MTATMASSATVAAACGVAGLLLGSFATVAIDRWPRGGRVNQPSRSRCSACHAVVAWRDNIPLVSWIALRGRCRSCGHAYGARYPLIEGAMAGVFALVGLVHAGSWLLPALLATAWVLVVAAAIDVTHTIIPNRLTLRAPVVVLVLVAGVAVIEGDGAMLVRAVLAAVGVPVVMLALSEGFRLLRGQAGIGMGDIKLAVTIGLAVGALGGWQLVVFAYASVFSAVIVALALMAAGRARLATRIPFGPYLALGALVAITAAGRFERWLGEWVLRAG